MIKLIEALRQIIVLGLSNNDTYCRTCGTWLKARNDLESHNKGFACGIAVTAIKEASKSLNAESIQEMLIDKVANKLSGMPTEEWALWKAQPYKAKILPTVHSPESLRNEAIDLIELINNNQVGPL